jgi:hypothetical protein
VLLPSSPFKDCHQVQTTRKATEYVLLSSSAYMFLLPPCSNRSFHFPAPSTSHFLLIYLSSPLFLCSHYLIHTSSLTSSFSFLHSTSFLLFSPFFFYTLFFLHHDPLSCFILFLHFLPVISFLAYAIVFAGSKIDKELDEFQEKAVTLEIISTYNSSINERRN